MNFKKNEKSMRLIKLIVYVFLSVQLCSCNNHFQDVKKLSMDDIEHIEYKQNYGWPIIKVTNKDENKIIIEWLKSLKIEKYYPGDDIVPAKCEIFIFLKSKNCIKLYSSPSFMSWARVKENMDKSGFNMENLPDAAYYKNVPISIKYKNDNIRLSGKGTPLTEITIKHLSEILNEGVDVFQAKPPQPDPKGAKDATR